MKKGLLIIGPVLCTVAALAFAAGGHEDLGCVGCHSIHDAKGELIFEVEPNTESLNPATGQSYTGVTALCLGCHEETGGAGILPVMGDKSHPYSVTPSPKVASVPAGVLRDGRLECVGCHDPHPSNPNYRYLRVDTANGGEMQAFCSMCHAAKSGTRSAAAIFDSMDERRPVQATASSLGGE